MQIKDYTPLTTPPSELDKFLVETSEGTRVVPYGVLKEDNPFLEVNPFGVSHKNFYRGKFLGNSVTEDQLEMIRSGNFDDLYIGDHWHINDRDWLIADFDYFYAKGSSDETYIKKHHAIIISPNAMGYGPIGYESEGAGGYASTTFRATQANPSIYQIVTDIIYPAFSEENVIPIPEINPNSINNGRIAGIIEAITGCTLLSVRQLVGRGQYLASNDGTYYPLLGGYDNEQLAIYKLLSPTLVHGRNNLWTKDQVSNTDYAYYGYDGIIRYTKMSDSAIFVVCFAIG